MTRLFIDRQEVDPLPPDLRSWDQLMRLVEARHLPPDSVIRQVQIDGRLFIPEKGMAMVREGLADPETVEIFTGTLRDIALDSIREAVVYLERVETATPSVAAGLRRGTGPEAFENLKELYEGFYWVNLLLDRLQQSFDVRLETVRLSGGNAREHHGKLASALKGILEAHEGRDYGLVADILEFEVVPLIQGCKETFGAVRSKMLAEA